MINNIGIIDQNFNQEDLTSEVRRWYSQPFPLINLHWAYFTGHIKAVKKTSIVGLHFSNLKKQSGSFEPLRSINVCFLMILMLPPTQMWPVEVGLKLIVAKAGNTNSSLENKNKLL